MTAHTATDTSAAAFRTPVRGHAFAGPPAPDATLAPGQRLRPVREPSNPADPYAVALWADAPGPWRVGYLDRTVAARLAPRLDAGVRLEVRHEGWVDAPGGWQRPLVALRLSAPSVDAEARPCRRRASGPELWGRPPGVSRRTVTAVR